MPRTRKNEQAALDKIRSISDARQLTDAALANPTRQNIRRLGRLAVGLAADGVKLGDHADELAHALVCRFDEIEDDQSSLSLWLQLNDVWATPQPAEAAQ